jgi:hypothetical protein
MGYRCPVCGDPQADDVHLANHLAFTAMLRGGDHEAWLDDHVDDWEHLGEAELAARVTDNADETDYPQVFEDTTDDASHDRPHAHDDGTHDGNGHAGGDHAVGGRAGGSHAPDPETLSAPDVPADELREIIEEAREITRKRRAGDDSERSTDGESGREESQTDGESEQGEGQTDT